MSAPGSQDPGLLYQHIASGQEAGCLKNIADTINTAFLSPMNVFEPLSEKCHLTPESEEHAYTLQVSQLSVLKKLATQLNPSKACGPDGMPGWILKEKADLLAEPVTDILNCSFKEARLPQSWKDADIAPVPKQKPVLDVNKHLCCLSSQKIT
ncbi:predicted protein [Nematostella vectensis]|uniref:Uncharacterized protein n=1 Tax=Nematostella vectensis TaxID=45351 RepID=A7SG51_NEMVE|nr:uncharacterized protein LOC5508835 [Nematostella vectensis]EDO37333.1 predicted protein [Nematostella vectensis]|eukprot:XP_001629396.1 predicted protein [Nematostella vectensis]